MKPASWLTLAWLVSSLSPLLPAAEELPAAPPSAPADSPAHAAVTAFRDGRPNAAVEMAKPLAARGDRDALFLLGFALESPSEFPRQSKGQAMEHYYRRAAEAGHPDAGMRRKLVLLASGTKEERSAIQHELEAAAEAKDPLACRILGEAWLRGFPTGKPDPDKALQLWEQAASTGDIFSLVLAAKFHAGDFGFTDKKDVAAAITCYRRAAEAGREDAYLPLAKLLLSGTGTDEALAWLEKAGKDRPATLLVAGDYLQQAKGDREAAQSCYQKGVDQGDPPCIHHLAALLLAGAETRTRGREWLQKAADAGDPEAAADLGELLLHTAEAADLATARRYLTAAAIEKVPRAQYQLGLAYLEGQGGPADPVAAVAWMTEATKTGDPEMRYKLATLHEEGIGTPVNYSNAGVLYTLACDKGHAAAAARIARMAAEGLGTTRSLAQAWAHASLAVELGDTSAAALREELDLKLDAAERSAAEQALAGLRARIETTAKPGNR